MERRIIVFHLEGTLAMGNTKRVIETMIACVTDAVESEPADKVAR